MIEWMIHGSTKGQNVAEDSGLHSTAEVEEDMASETLLDALKVERGQAVALLLMFTVIAKLANLVFCLGHTGLQIVILPASAAMFILVLDLVNTISR
jgi:hypothetical protein